MCVDKSHANGIKWGRLIKWLGCLTAFNIEDDIIVTGAKVVINHRGPFTGDSTWIFARELGLAHRGNHKPARAMKCRGCLMKGYFPHYFSGFHQLVYQANDLVADGG